MGVMAVVDVVAVEFAKRRRHGQKVNEGRPYLYSTAVNVVKSIAQVPPRNHAFTRQVEHCLHLEGMSRK